MRTHSCFARTFAIMGKRGWARVRAGLFRGGRSALARFIPAAVAAGMAASAPALAADMPRPGRCTVGPGPTALLKRVQLRPNPAGAAIVFTFEEPAFRSPGCGP